MSYPFSFILIVCLLLNTTCTNPSDEKKASTDDEKVLPPPSWVADFPMVFAGFWDTMPIFQIRRGGSPVWQEEEYYKSHSEETILKLKESGITMALIHFYKGNGIRAEKEHIDDARHVQQKKKKYK